MGKGKYHEKRNVLHKVAGTGFRRADFGSLLRGDSITVNGSAYTVREARLIDDGLFVEIALQLS